MQPPSRAELTAHHRRLDALFERVLYAFQVGDREQLTAIWSEFEPAVLAHMDAEEIRVFPSFRLVDPDEAARLLVDHRAFRKGLSELGVATDLHLGRLEAARELVEKLRIHVRKEDALMYRTAASE